MSPFSFIIDSSSYFVVTHFFFLIFCGFRDKNLGIVQETIRITGEGTREVWREETREKLMKARDIQEEEE